MMPLKRKNADSSNAKDKSRALPVIISLLGVAALVCIDQLIKYIVVLKLKPVVTVDVIKGVLSFTYVENCGAAFGSFSAYTAALTVVSIILLIATLYLIVTQKTKSRFADVCLVLMTAGGIGNVTDRIRLHYVIDFIEPKFVRFAVFNFADCLITVGAFALIIYLFVDLSKDSTRQTENITKNGSPRETKNGNS